MSSEPLLRVDRLRKHYAVTKGILFARTIGQVKAVDDISFTLQSGETLGLVGESGCGKTTTSKLILNLEEPTDGEVLLQGKPIHGLSGDALRAFRATVQAVFQDPWSSLNPRMTVGRTIAESLIVNGWDRSSTSTRACASCWRRSDFVQSRHRNTLTSSAAASASALLSRQRSPPGRSSSCWTSRSRRSTCRSARK